MSSDSKTQNWRKGSRRSPPRYWEISHSNLKWFNDFLNGKMIPEDWKENFRMSECSFFILQGKVNTYDIINNLDHLIVSLQMETGNVPDWSNNISISIWLQNLIDRYRTEQKAIRYNGNIRCLNTSFVTTFNSQFSYRILNVVRKLYLGAC